MAAQICIKMARGTFFHSVNIANRYPSFFKLDTPIGSIFPRVYDKPNFSTRLISLSKPHPKVLKVISNNSKNNVKHNKFEKHKWKVK